MRLEKIVKSTNSKKSGRFQSPAQPQLDAINHSMERQSKLRTLNGLARRFSRYAIEQLE